VGAAFSRDNRFSNKRPIAAESRSHNFCLMVIQRRHVADTNLIINGKTAQQWMSIARAYAGPPT
jgi:hypothetical protein